MSEPFEDSRRLTGCNFYFAGTGAALETARGLSFDDESLARWRDNVVSARRALGWPDAETIVRKHRSGASLAFVAPSDQLYTATEVNEWAWWSAVAGSPQNDVFHAPGHAAIWDAELALRTLKAVACAEANPALVALLHVANALALPFLPDDDAVSIGAGEGNHTWPLDALPVPSQVDWSVLHAIPTALVTGSNGKTTTVRLLAAMSRAQGWHAAHSCTDGVFFDGDPLESGDFSGPTGTRTVLRQPRAQAAILEIARGGLLRRGLAICRADVAVVTNISADHFGEYGIHDLDDLAAVKLTVARAIGADGLLVLNADDRVLVRRAQALSCPIGWFALDFDQTGLAAHRQHGGATCGAHAGRLLLSRDGAMHELGEIATMPLTLAGRAAYNIANIAAAALAASALGIAPETIASVLLRFGAAPDDNPGRLQRWYFGGMQVYVDYAHNPEGLHGLLQAVGARGRKGRLAMILGHAGNREDADLRAVAAVAAAFAPELVVLKDISGYERGRASGEVAAIMQAQLRAAGLPQDAIETQLDEVAAARRPLEWARDGDLVVLPVHELAARTEIIALLDAMQSQHWKPGAPLPEREGAGE